MKAKEIKDPEKVRCPFCDSSFNYYKLKDAKWQCRSCGKEFGKEDLKE